MLVVSEVSERGRNDE